MVDRGRSSAKSLSTGPNRTNLAFAFFWLNLGGFGLFRSAPDSWQRTSSIGFLVLAALYVLAACWWQRRRE